MTEIAGGKVPPAQVEKGIERLLSVQRPLVLAHVRSIRKHHPDASPAKVIQILERRYLVAVTGGGAAVGASAVIPGVGVGISLALSGVEAIANMTGIMVEPVEKTARRSPRTGCALRPGCRCRCSCTDG